MSHYEARGRFGSFRANGKTHVTAMSAECMEDGVTSVKLGPAAAPSIFFTSLTCAFGHGASTYSYWEPIVLQDGGVLEWRTTHPVDVQVRLWHKPAPEGE